MKKKIITTLIFVLPVVISLNLISCKKVFEVQPKSVITANNMYRNVFDADAAVIGIYGKFLGIMDRYVILNELRADLTDITPNSNKYLKQLSTHSVTSDNTYADPRPFYTVIANCNDALANFNIMVAQHKMTVDQYNQRYSDIGAVRSWLYLQIGIQYGTIPYVTDPIVNVNDLSDQTKYPRIGLPQLVNKLVQFMESLPYHNPYASGSTLLTTFDTYNTSKMFVDKNCLLGDLYLWQGSWTKAATSYMAAVAVAQIPYQIGGASEQTFEYNKLGYSYITGSNWKNIFNQSYGERYSNYEIMWDLPFDANFNPKNPFIDLFTTTSNTNSYLIQPSALVINSWNMQFRNDNGSLPGTPTDLRGLGASYVMAGLQPQINKYTAAYNPLQPFATNGKVILYRAANLYLRFAEAANHDGRDRLAMAFINNGIAASFCPSPVPVDVTNYEQSTDPSGRIDPATGLAAFDVAPYYFDARNGTYPYYRSQWYRNIGVRDRAADAQVVIDSTRSFNMSVTPRVVTNRTNLVNDVEDIIINEAGLETAFEGNRWGDLLRIALRRQATDPNYLANKIGAKFDAAHSVDGAAVRARLANPANWYLPFKWQ